MIELTPEEWKIIRDLSDSLKLYPEMQLLEYAQNKDYNYVKKTCCAYQQAINLKHLVTKKGI